MRSTQKSYTWSYYPKNYSKSRISLIAREPIGNWKQKNNRHYECFELTFLQRKKNETFTAINLNGDHRWINSHSSSDTSRHERFADAKDRVARGLDALPRELCLLGQVHDRVDCRLPRALPDHILRCHRISPRQTGFLNLTTSRWANRSQNADESGLLKRLSGKQRLGLGGLRGAWPSELSQLFMGSSLLFLPF